MSKPLAALLAAGLLVGPPVLLLAVSLLGTTAGVACATPSETPPATTEPGDDAAAGGQVPETTRLVMPLPAGSYTVSDSYGSRTDPFTGLPAFHAGTDFPARAGTQVLAIGDGVVLLVGDAPTGWGNYIVLTHSVDGQSVASLYGHLLDDGIHVTAGQVVQAGDWIGDVGSTGRSTGPHLHLEIRPGGWGHDTVDPLDWLAGHGAQDAPPGAGPAGCVPASTP
jgi:murein DD-endopeptidase MepM/ murein hydrolase activator NlpD